VTEVIPHINVVPKVFLLVLFLDIESSSLAGVSAHCINVRLFLRDDQKCNGRKCGVKVACFHPVNGLKYKNIPINDVRGNKSRTKL